MNPSDPKKHRTNSDVIGKSEIGKSEGRGDKTDESLTPPHGDPEKAHLGTEPDLREKKDVITTEDQIKNMENEGPGPAEGRTDNKAGG